MTTHVVKSWPKFFEAIRLGQRRHELRKNDRTPKYAIGDHLEMHEWEPAEPNFAGRYTGRVLTVEITSETTKDNICAVSQEALHPDYCIFSVRPLYQQPPAVALLNAMPRRVWPDTEERNPWGPPTLDPAGD